jgi:hypothetical protein
LRRNDVIFGIIEIMEITRVRFESEVGRPAKQPHRAESVTFRRDPSYDFPENMPQYVTVTSCPKGKPTNATFEALKELVRAGIIEDFSLNSDTFLSTYKVELNFVIKNDTD